MVFPVRIFGYSGMTRILLDNDGGKGGQDSFHVLTQPYIWSQMLEAGETAVSSTVVPVPPKRTLDPTTLLRIEIPDGESIRYEINHDGRCIPADANSPLLTGINQIQFAPGWTISVMDAAKT